MVVRNEQGKDLGKQCPGRGDKHGELGGSEELNESQCGLCICRRESDK